MDGRITVKQVAKRLGQQLRQINVVLAEVSE